MILLLCFVLILHFGFGIFQILTFAAYVNAVTENSIFEIFVIFILLLLLCVEGIFFYCIFSIGLQNVILLVLATLSISSICASLSLAAFHKLDLAIWLPFSVLFAPPLTIPILCCMWIFFSRLRGAETMVCAPATLTLTTPQHSLASKNSTT